MKSYLPLIVLSIFSVCFQFNMVFANPPENGWKLKWEDHFDGSMVDTKAWNIANNSAHKDSNLHLYRPQNVSLGSGLLKIKNKALSKGRFVGGLINSKRRFKYGYFEIKCHISQPSSNVIANFGLGNRNKSDIVIMGWDHIQFQQNQGPAQTHFISDDQKSSFSRKSLDPSEEHRYGLLWTPDELSFYLDDHFVGTSKRSDLSTDLKPLRLYLFSNHDWTNPSKDKVKSLPHFIVDYIKVWEKTSTDSNEDHTIPPNPLSANETHSTNSYVVKIDTTLKEYTYDFGTIHSPVEEGQTKISPETSGDIHWLNKPHSNDRGPGTTNKWNRDLVFGNKPSTLRHKLAHGIWKVVMTMGDSSFSHDQISVTAEGSNPYKAKPTKANEFADLSFMVHVKDGWLDLSIADEGGVDPNWVLSKMTITAAPDSSPIDEIQPTSSHAVKIDTTLKEYSYDFGTVFSPVEEGRTKISPETSGDIQWLNKPRSTDRGPDLTNQWNRDLVFGKKPNTLRHKLANGIWKVVMTMGDPSYNHDLISVTAEDSDTYTSKPTKAGEFTDISFTVNVQDGELDLTISDTGGADPNWVLSKMNLTRQ